MVRAKAQSVRGHLAEAAAGTSGAAQVQAVKAALPDTQLEAVADGPGVVVTGTLSERAEAGGGLSYQGFTARVCLRYAVAADSGETTIADAPCPPLGPEEPSFDEIVRLAG